MDGLDLAHPPGDSTWSVCSPQQPPGSPIVVAAVVVVKIPSSSPTPSSSMRRMRYRRMRRTGRERASGVAFFEVRRNHAFNDIRSYCSLSGFRGLDKDCRMMTSLGDRAVMSVNGSHVSVNDNRKIVELQRDLLSVRTLHTAISFMKSDTTHRLSRFNNSAI
ncbi:uncharacterized protein [Physcomitrium patens]|uniref:uncharacterized protein n=1 Tax=Physcomitrium patens TaxID=3218 RepID=UPI00016248FD